MNQFAKLFGGNDDQILAIIQRGNDGPEIRVFVKPADLGVCSIAVGYDDDDAGWDIAEQEFAKIDEDKARCLAKGIFDLVSAETKP